MPLVAGHIKNRLGKVGINDPDISKRLADLDADTRRLMGMAKQLTFDKYSGKLVPLQVSAVVNEAVSAAQVERINPDIEVIKEISPDLPPVRAVEIPLVDTLANLLQNAAEANASEIRHPVSCNNQQKT